MKCKICDSTAKHIFSAKIMSKYNIRYYGCPECGYLQNENPYWLKEAYQRPINFEDTGLLSRNILLTEKSAAIIF
jgi:hypothetical protein